VAWGLGLLVLGIVSALAVWGGSAGLLGRGLESGLADALGVVRMAVPVALVVISVDLLVGHPLRRLKRSVLLGLAAVVVAVSGLMDLSAGSPALTGPLADLRSAGGALGAGATSALEALVGHAGAAAVLSALGVLGLSIVLERNPVALAVDGWVALQSRRALRREQAEAGDPLGGVELRSPPAEGEDEAGGAREGQASPEVHSAKATMSTRALSDAGDPSPGPQAAGPEAGASERRGGRERPVHRSSGPREDGTAEQGDGRSGERASDAQGVEPDLVLSSSPERPGQRPWRLPPVTLLERSVAERISKQDAEAEGRRLCEALAAHGVETSLLGATVGPTVTRFELELGPGVKVQRITSLYRDIAYAMAAADVRILAPIPGRSAIGVEVPNRRRQLVTLGDVLTSPEARVARHPLEVALGRDIAGRAVMVSLAEMPHVLIAGATGAGKSSCLNSMLTSILLRATPDQVRLILIDPKRVELGQYNGLPHLLTQVVVNPKRAANALAWAVKEMERRYDVLAEAGARDITGYNRLADEAADAEARDAELQALPFIVVVVDELNDLMMVAARDVEESICRLAQMARAVGIHLVIATQRPSVDVITGLIKANIPSRIAFSVSSLADSRVILDQPGAERLVGKGDMLFLGASSSVARRIQAPWVSEAEVRAVAGAWKRQGGPAYVEGVEGATEEASAGGGGEAEDPLLDAAMELVVDAGFGSTSMLQRKLRVGFSRAGRLMDALERHGVVGPSEGSKARPVLMSREELELVRAGRGPLAGPEVNEPGAGEDGMAAERGVEAAVDPVDAEA